MSNRVAGMWFFAALLVAGLTSAAAAQTPDPPAAKQPAAKQPAAKQPAAKQPAAPVPVTPPAATSDAGAPADAAPPDAAPPPPVDAAPPPVAKTEPDAGAPIDPLIAALQRMRAISADDRKVCREDKKSKKDKKDKKAEKDDDKPLDCLTSRYFEKHIGDFDNGTCRTPLEAWVQIFQAKKSGKRGAKCVNAALLDDPSEAPKLSQFVHEAIDKTRVHVQMDEIPHSEAWMAVKTDKGINHPKIQRYVYHSGSLRWVVLQYDTTTHTWLFTRETLLRGEDKAPASAKWKRKLPSWMLKRFLDIELWSWMGILVLIFLAIMVQKFIVFFIGTYVRRVAAKTNLKYLDKAVSRASRPIGGLVMAGVFYIGLPLLLFPIKVLKPSYVLTEGLAAFSVVWLGYRMIDILADVMQAKADKTDSRLDDQLVPLVTKTLKVFVSIIGGIFILQNLDVNVGSLLAGLGLGGLAFALAAKDTIANFFGSVMIFIDKPFQIGDWVVISTTEGVVEEVGFRTTRVRTFYNSVITVPNATIVNTMVDNYGARKYRRYVTTLGLAYDTPPEKIQGFCEGVRAIIAGMPGMRKDYYLVEFREFDASSLNVMVYSFMIAPSWNDELRTRTNLNLEIIRLAQELGVSFAFPTQTLHIETQAKEGESRPSHGGPSDPQELGKIITSFGPHGSRAIPKRANLSRGYDCGGDYKESQDGDGEGDGGEG